MSRLLTARDVVVSFQGVRALDGVDFEASSGEVIGLIGPNGAGKTTLVNVLTGFQAASQGSVSFDGVDITNDSPQRRARSGVARTFQGARIFPDMTVAENVEVAYCAAGHSRRSARQEAAETLSSFRLSGLSGRSASDLTTGQERVLQVARAAAMQPRLMFLDEPGAGLNDQETDRLVRTLREVRDRLSCVIVVIEHDMRMIMAACSRLVVLNNGKVIANDSPQEVRRDPVVIEAYLGS